MLEVNSIYLSRNKKQILNNFNFKLKKKQVFLLVGENGSGKTSLLDLIVGLIEPDKGSIKINGINVSELGLLKRKIFTYIPHKNCLKENLSVNENLINWLKISGIKINDSVYQKKLEKLNIINLQDKIVKNLSHGQKKKVSLTKLVLSNSNLWVLDEPLNGLDNKTIIIVKNLMKNHLDKNGTIFFSSHVQINMKINKKIILKKIINKKQKTSLDNWKEL